MLTLKKKLKRPENIIHYIKNWLIGTWTVHFITFIIFIANILTQDLTHGQGIKCDLPCYSRPLIYNSKIVI